MMLIGSRVILLMRIEGTRLTHRRPNGIVSRKHESFGLSPEARDQWKMTRKWDIQQTKLYVENGQ